MYKKIVIGNWKMNPVYSKEAVRLFTNILKNISDIKKTEIVICPPFIYLENLRSITKKYKKILLGAQNSFYEDGGAYTGEISSQMLDNMGVKYVILGHSERRSFVFGEGENNELINKKIKASISAGLIPILCIGEKERDESHEYLNLVKKQVEECLSGISKNSISSVIVAYEPVWAVGRGSIPAKPEEFLEMNIFIKKILSDRFGVKEASNIKILYGGSVDEKNVSDFINIGKADGFLVGRASLNAKKFINILKKCEV